MKIGFGTTIWLRDNHLQDFNRMLDDMGLIGFDGIEFYFYVYETYMNNREKLRRLLDMHGLELSSYYATVAFNTKEDNKRTMDRAKDIYRFARDLGAKHVLMDECVLDHKNVFNVPDAEERTSFMADSANELGEFARGMGLQLSYHQHWGSYFQLEAPFHLFMAKTDPNLVHFCCDTAQVRVSGWDEVETVRHYANRMSYVHFKDVTFEGRPQGPLWPGGPLVPDNDGPYSIDSAGRIVELGRGAVRFFEIRDILLAAGFDGWIVDDHDFTGYPAYDSAKACKDYLNLALGLWGEKDKMTAQTAK